MDRLSADLSGCYRIERELARGGGTGQTVRAQNLWLCVFVEGVAIVSAILLAFGPQVQIRRSLALSVRCDHINS